MYRLLRIKTEKSEKKFNTVTSKSKTIKDNRQKISILLKSFSSDKDVFDGTVRFILDCTYQLYEGSCEQSGPNRNPRYISFSKMFRVAEK